MHGATSIASMHTPLWRPDVASEISTANRRPEAVSSRPRTTHGKPPGLVQRVRGDGVDLDSFTRGRSLPSRAEVDAGSGGAATTWY